MPIDVTDLDGGRGVAFLARPPTTVADLIAAKEELLTQARTQPPRLYLLVDLSAAAGASATAEQIRRLADLDVRLARHWPRFVVTVVAPDDLTFGLAREWQTYAEDSGWETRVVRTRDEAEAWTKERVEEMSGERVTLG